ncbi:MAG: hypothetical protein HN392_13605 [Anaerolineae bacterium]|jgi:predicted hydrocarbon binding protein|nr:hypothetical protein [Anaerolineae bacterium]MBT7074728.1 hypothetical protein [Anaerolineae bacterium]MBT7782984.1 hypothetical protein [Anaerolineae bacterium]
MTNKKAKFSVKILENLVAITAAEIGKKNLPIVLNKSKLPKEWAEDDNLAKMNEEEAAESYAGLQQAIRAYYGRGARGILQRIGRKLWGKLLETASFKEKVQAKLLRGLPETIRRKNVLELLTRLLDTEADEMSVHTLDLNLLLADNTSPTTHNQHDDEPICHITHGLIREAIYWATSKDAVIEESSCRATGATNCEFKIIVGE